MIQKITNWVILSFSTTKYITKNCLEHSIETYIYLYVKFKKIKFLQIIKENHYFQTIDLQCSPRINFNLFDDNLTKWSNTFKQFDGSCRRFV